jgi:hypothetical protein
MSHSLDVQVLDSDGDPMEDAKVQIIIDGVFTGGSLEEFTDSDGHAEFETADDYESSRKLNVYVRGQSFGPYYIDGGAYTVQLE